MWIEPLIYGFSMGFSLILAIGAQNAFVMKCGLTGTHIFWVCLICATADAILVSVGVSGFYLLVQSVPNLELFARIGGAIFLSIYGCRSFYLSFTKNEVLEPSQQQLGNLSTTLLTCLAFTFLNPHVYLDTVVLLGSVSTKFHENSFYFGLGAVISSFVFFFSLGYGAILLRPVFKHPRSWKILDFIIGLIMLSLAIGLISDLS